MVSRVGVCLNVYLPNHVNVTLELNNVEAESVLRCMLAIWVLGVNLVKSKTDRRSVLLESGRKTILFVSRKGLGRTLL